MGIMFKFLKTLYDQRLKVITIILLNDNRPGEDNSFKLRPNRLFFSLIGICVLFSFIILGLFLSTPLGSLVYTKNDAKMRTEIESISQRLISLQDSIYLRDIQLSEMKYVIRNGFDTTFNTDKRFLNEFENSSENEDQYSNYESVMPTATKLKPSGIVFSNRLKAEDFPSSYPTKGSYTRGFDLENLHFGIDIATTEKELVSSVADGTVVSASWTINDGYVLTIQHAAGILSVYKHCETVSKQSGDVILKGDFICTIGDVGLSSSGPHLHFEIWKDGIPQDPTLYLIN